MNLWRWFRVRRRASGASPRWRRSLGVFLTVTISAALGLAGTRLTAQAVEPVCTTGVTVSCTFGGFEIDGNTTSDGGTDWTSSAVNASAAYTNFYDLFN